MAGICVQVSTEAQGEEMIAHIITYLGVATAAVSKLMEIICFEYEETSMWMHCILIIFFPLVFISPFIVSLKQSTLIRHVCIKLSADTYYMWDPV